MILVEQDQGQILVILEIYIRVVMEIQILVVVVVLVTMVEEVEDGFQRLI